MQNGFENDTPIAPIETGFVSSDLQPGSDAPLFQLGRVQYAFSAPLALMTVASNILTMCLYNYLSPTPTPNPFPNPPPKLVRINLDDPQRTIEAELPIPPAPRANRNQPPQDPATIGPHKMFTDPSGTHLLLSMRNGDNYYWTSSWGKARLLNKLRGIVIDSVAWNKLSDSSSASSSSSRARRANGSTTLVSTREILLGTRSGDIYEAVITAPAGPDPDEGDFFDKLARRTAGAGADRAQIDRIVRHVFTLPERQPITGISVEPFPRSSSASSTSSSGSTAQRAVVIATTSTRIYEFVGPLGKATKADESESESLYDKLFEPYRGDAVPNLKSELPGDLPYSELHMWGPPNTRESTALAWLTAPGVYHAMLSYADQQVGDSVVDSANLLPYPAVEPADGVNPSHYRQSTASSIGGAMAEIPLSIALTEFHFILLYQDRVMALNSLDDQVVFQEALPLKANERVIGTAVDVAKRTFWVYTDASIFELVVRDEDRDVWRIYLERGSFDASLKYAKPGVQRGTVLSSQGDRFFAEGRYIQAAQCYAQTFMRAFEEIVLRFIDIDERDALRYYLVMRLERLNKVDVSQRIMLATWLVEIYLSKIDQLEDIAAAEAASQDVDNYHVEKGMITEELHQFLSTYRNELNPATTYSLLTKHGRSDVLLHFATVIGDYDRIIRFHVQEEAWAKAIDAINRQTSDELYYRYSTVLIRHAPAETVDCWTRRKSLDPRRLIPALLQHRPAVGETNHAVRYLRHVVDRDDNTDAAIHNLLLALLARAATAHKDAKAELLALIDSAKSNPLTGAPYFDLDYALRTCAAKGQKEACVRIYAKMGLYESAVDLAIQEKDTELACSCADMVDMDPDLKKKLWLKVTKEVVRTTKDMKQAMEFLRRTDLISIEDALPFFSDFVVIDDCKDEICAALEGYAARIEGLKDEMDEASRSALAIQRDISRLSERFVSIDVDQKCAHCQRSLTQRQFFVFPCRHGFHADCLVAEATKTMPTRNLRKMLELQQQISSLTSGVVPAVPSSLGFLKEPLRGLDRLRELVVPDAVISAISTGVSVGVAGGRRALAPLDPFSHPTSGWVAGADRERERERDRVAQRANGVPQTTVAAADKEERVQILRDQLDSLIASSCLVCDGAANAIARPFVTEKESLDEWAL